MHSLQHATPIVNQNTDISPLSIPYIWGAQDARCGMLCVPEMFFATKKDQREYAAGYESISGPTLTTRQFAGGQVQ